MDAREAESKDLLNGKSLSRAKIKKIKSPIRALTSLDLIKREQLIPVEPNKESELVEQPRRTIQGKPKKVSSGLVAYKI